MSRKNNTYDKAFKLKAIHMYIDQGFSLRDIIKELGIKSKTQVMDWVKTYKEKGEAVFDEEARGKSKGSLKGRAKTKFVSLEEEIQYLRMENEFLKKLKALREK